MSDSLSILEKLDWTLKLLEDKDVVLFRSEVVWPALDRLYHRDHDTLYDEQFMKIEVIVGFRTDKGLNPVESAAVSSAKITLEERMVHDESDELRRDNNGLQIWRKTSFFFGADESKPIQVDTYCLFKHPVKGVIQNLTTSQQEILKSLDYDGERQNLCIQDCLEIINIFVVLGVPQEDLDERMSEFRQRLDSSRG